MEDTREGDHARFSIIFPPCTRIYESNDQITALVRLVKMTFTYTLSRRIVANGSLTHVNTPLTRTPNKLVTLGDRIPALRQSCRRNSIELVISIIRCNFRNLEMHLIVTCMLVIKRQLRRNCVIAYIHKLSFSCSGIC